METLIKGLLTITGAGLILLIIRAIGVTVHGEIELTDFLMILATSSAAIAASFTFLEMRKERQLKIRKELHYIAALSRDAYFLLLNFGSNVALSPSQITKFIKIITEIEQKGFAMPTNLYQLKVDAFKFNYLLINNSNHTYDIIKEDNEGSRALPFTDITRQKVDWLSDNRFTMAEKYERLSVETMEYIEQIRHK